MKSHAPLSAALGLLSQCTGIQGAVVHRRATTNVTEVYDFSELTPSPELIWTPCYGDRQQNFTCALLEVPLDYAEPSAGTTAIAFLKKPSQNPDARDILLNSGGPGGSGVDMALNTYERLEDILGKDDNLIGFDPRGVNNSGPSLACFTGPMASLQQSQFFSDVYTAVDGRDERDLELGFQRAGAFGEWCTGTLAVEGKARYANTPAVAQDMLHYIELSAKAKGLAPEEAKLNFYGISYGTALGATYAALYPNRINRMILDGVLDLEDYYNTGWKTTLTSNVAATRQLWKTCFEAGPTVCPFHKNASSWEELEARYIAIYEKLHESPIYFADPTIVPQPVHITWQDVSTSFFGTAYTPLAYYPQLAQVFADVEEGNFTALALADPELVFSAPGLDPFDSRGARGLISCIDMDGRYNLSTIDLYREHVEFQVNTSWYGGPNVNAIMGTICRNVNIFPPESQKFDGKVGRNGTVKTSEPILFVSAELDPITPLASAKKMSGLFEGSALLEADSTGHTTFFTPKSCTHEYTKAYMADATLPAEGTICQEPVRPFGLPGFGKRGKKEKRDEEFDVVAARRVLGL